MIRQFDEVTLPLEYDNNIENYVKYISEYFDKSPVSKERKEQRKSVAEEIRDALIFFLLLTRMSIESNTFDYDSILNTFRIEFRQVVERYLPLNDYVLSYINTETKEILDSTINNIDRASYFLSEDRATVVSVNEASVIVNYKELQTAIDKGYTKKIWVSQRDGKVRHSHSIADGQIRDINDYFIVGGSAMMIPHDPECTDMEEIAGCRCAMKFK